MVKDEFILLFSCFDKALGTWERWVRDKVPGGGSWGALLVSEVGFQP